MPAAGCHGAATDSSSEANAAAKPTAPKASTAPASEKDTTKPTEADPASAESTAAPASNRPSNPNGKVFVLEYHNVCAGKGDFFRPTDKFRQDLERLYTMGFRPVNVTDYLENRMPLPKGASPAVFTFDDADPSQIRFNPDGTLDPNCAVGIWQAFAQKHPDFPVRATFFVLPEMWNQKQFVTQKVALLRKMGSELGNHTITHPILRKLSDDRVKEEIGDAELKLKALGVPLPASMALPFGSSPRNKALLKGFDWKGIHVAPKAVFLVGANPAPAPTDPKLNRLAIPRIQAYDGPFGIDYWLDRVQKGEVKLYVR